MIFPLPQHAWGKRPLVAPSHSQDSVQRMRAAASAGSKNSMSMETSIGKDLVSTFMPGWRPADMARTHQRMNPVTERSVASAPACNASGIRCP